MYWKLPCFDAVHLDRMYIRSQKIALMFRIVADYFTFKMAV